LIDILYIYIITCGIYGAETGVLNRLNKNLSVLPQTIILSIGIAITFSLLLSSSIEEVIMFFLLGILISYNELKSIMIRFQGGFNKSLLVQRLPYLISTLALFVFPVNPLYIFLTVYALFVVLTRVSLVTSTQEKWLDRNTNYLQLNNILVTSYERVDQIILAVYFPINTLVNYFLISKVSLAAKFLTRNLYQITYPSILKGESHTKFENILSFSVILNFLTLVPLIFVSEHIFSYLEIEQDYMLTVFYLFNIVHFNSSLNITINQFLNASDNSKYNFINSVLLIISQISLIVVLFEQYGVLSLIFAKLISSYFAMTLCIFQYRTVFKKFPDLKVFLFFKVLLLCALYVKY
jgi:hypothetical protein